MPASRCKITAQTGLHPAAGPVPCDRPSKHAAFLILIKAVSRSTAMRFASTAAADRFLLAQGRQGISRLQIIAGLGNFSRSRPCRSLSSTRVDSSSAAASFSGHPLLIRLFPAPVHSRPAASAASLIPQPKSAWYFCGLPRLPFQAVAAGFASCSTSRPQRRVRF